MPRGVLDRAQPAEQDVTAGTSRRLNPGDGHHSGREGPGLVEQHGVHTAGGLQRLVALDENPQLSTPPARHQQGGRGPKPTAKR